MFTPAFQRLSAPLELPFSCLFFFFADLSESPPPRISVLEFLEGSRSVFVLLPEAAGVAPSLP